MNVNRLVHGKSWLHLNKDLNKVARLHLENLKDSLKYNKKVNPHSWFSDAQNRWTPCVCYKSKDLGRCGYKAQEITGYKGEDGEIYCDENGLGSRSDVRLWMKSTLHRNTILEQGCFSDTKWKSCGISIFDNKSCIWFGTTK